MRKLVSAAFLAGTIAACGGTTVSTTLEQIGETPSPAPTATVAPTPSPTPTVAPTPTPTATPSPTPTLAASPSSTGTPSPSSTGTPAAGPPSADCIHGWTSPPEGTETFENGVLILGSYMGLNDPFNVDVLDVDDIRYFRGPDPENILEPRYENLERWYIKAHLDADPTYAGRWLIEKRTDTILGVSAIAPYDTTGWQSPDWSGFEGDGAPRAIPGLPGKWGGIQYDFVTGDGDSGFPGLPASQVGCLAGT